MPDASSTQPKSRRIADGGRRWRRFAVLAAALLAFVIVPFALFGDRLEALSRDLVSGTTSTFAAATAGFLLLAADVALPVPSTLVITALGSALGLLNGTAVAVAGLTLGCLIGYGLGLWLGHDFAERSLGPEDFGYLHRQLDRYGVLVLALCRPVPVLAEASVIVAGVAGMGLKQVLVVTTLANVVFASVYALLGAAAGSGSGLALALAASAGLSLAAIVVARVMRRAG